MRPRGHVRGAAALALAALLTAAGDGRAQAPPRAPSQAPSDWRLLALDGREVAFAELAGRPLVVNFWATWCLPCVAELRSFERLAAELAGLDVGLVLVAPQDAAAVAEWVRRRGYELPFYVEATRIPGSFGLEAVPTTWVLDRAGRVVIEHRGAAEWDRPEVVALLRRLAREPRPRVSPSPP